MRLTLATTLFGAYCAMMIHTWFLLFHTKISCFCQVFSVSKLMKILQHKADGRGRIGRTSKQDIQHTSV